MKSLAEGDDQALNRLMDTWSGPLLAYLTRLTGSTATAGDLAQEAFVRVYRHRFDFRAGHRFSTWLFSIATNLARNHVRWQNRHPEVLLSPENLGALPNQTTEETPEKQVVARERAAAVQTAISELPADMREALILSVWHEMSHGEIAQVQDTSEKAVELRVYRARKLLREKLEGQLT
ncbi:MAG: RNA polymerase sigma factor [Prosthecobacter sp.]